MMGETASTELSTDIPQTVWAAYERAFDQAGDCEAIVEGDQRLTYSGLQSAAEVVASGLVSKGIKPGEHVGLCLGNGPLWVIIFCGILRAGAVCVPVNTRLKPGEIAHQLRQADVKLLFSVDTLLNIDFLKILDEICPELAIGKPSPNLPTLEQIIVIGARSYGRCESFATFCADATGGLLPAEPKPDDGALIQFTSGTTSLPKGVLLTHKNMVTDAYYVGQKMGLQKSDRYMSARPFFHVAGSTLSVVVSAVHQTTLITMQRFTAEAALRLLAEENCTHTSGNDTMFLMMLGSPEFKSHSYQLRGGWAAASPSIMNRIVTEFGATEMVVAYGLSEASPNITLSSIDMDVSDRIAGWMTPHDGLEVNIVDPETNETMPVGKEGEIRVRGWCVMAGYYKQPEATQATMTGDGFLKTGDVGVMRENGDIRFVGRLKEIIRVGGENVAPSDIENVINQHPAVRQAVAFGLPDPRLIEVPAIYVQLRKGAELTDEELLLWAKERLAGFKLPKYLKIVENFESIGMTASSKIQKKQLVKHAIAEFGLEEAG